MAIFDGRKLGPATALVDEDMLRVLLLEAGGGDKTIQLRYDSIGSVEIANASVTVKCRDGRTLVAGSEEAEALRQGLLAACRALPEVTRALRALGSRRGIVGGARRNPTDREGRFFAPLIAARRASMDARDARGVIGAFDARELTRSLSAIVAVFAREVAAGHPARQRALEAELSDGVESLERALEQLQQLAQAAQSDVEDLTRWRHWAAGVQRVFEAADRAWVTIESSLEGR
jgi:methyl-accepting chemotaxis protein